MKKVIRLTESDLVRIVNKVIEESSYRAKFENQKDNYWTDEQGDWVDYDPDLESTGYYDFDYDPYTSVDNFEDIPDDIKNRLFGKHDGKKFYDAYTKRDGRFQYSRKKDF